MHCFPAWYRVCQGLAMLTLAALVIITVYFLCWAYSYSRYYFNKIMILVIVGGTGKYLTIRMYITEEKNMIIIITMKLYSCSLDQ